MTLKSLEALGLDPKGLQVRFDTPTPGPKEKALIDRWRARVQAGREWNLQHYRVFLAIDRAWDSDFYQSSQTLASCLKDITEQKNEEDALAVARKWKMTHLIVSDIDPKTQKPTGKSRLHLPTLYEIILSLARNYTLMRVSRLVTERLNVPLFKYEPAMSVDKNRAITEVLTQRVDQMAREFGYSAIFDQAVTYAGMYGHQLQFISEEWFTQNTLTEAGAVPTKEGLRYTLPHPSRSYYDTDFPVWTLNTGTGCRYAGYWQVVKLSTLLQNRAWWNLDRIKVSTSMHDDAWNLFFQTTGQCRMALGNPEALAYQGVGGELDRQGEAERFYSRDKADVPVWTTEHFELINLRDFDDNYPDADVWFRVTLASDDTPIYMAPLPDRAVTGWLWEPTDNRSIQLGMMLTVMPFQDHCSNLMTQGILSAKQGLANVTLYDSDVVNKEDVSRDIGNPNECLYRKLNFWGFSGRLLARQEGNVDRVFKSYRFPPQDISDHLRLLNILLSTLERVLGMSAQEVGSYASHEQSAEEVRAIHTATGHRFEHIASWIDRGIEAWKSQLYSFLMEYGTLDAYAYISADMLPMIQDAGFSLVEAGEKGVVVAAPVGKLRVEHFTSQRDGPNRVPWTQIGQQMIQLLQVFLANPQTQQLMGPENLVKLVNMSLESMGLPRSFRLDLASLQAQAQQGGGPEEIQALIQEQLAAFSQQVKKYVDESQTKLLTELAKASPAPEPGTP